jgi:hypothetical protein
MTDDSSSTPEPRQSRFQFGIASLLLLTLLVACILSVGKCLGPVYGLLSAIPLSIVAILLLSTCWRCVVGTLIGSVVFALLGFYILQWDPLKPEYVKAVVTLAAFGGAIGASIHTIVLKRLALGGIFLALSILILLGTLLG